MRNPLEVSPFSPAELLAEASSRDEREWIPASIEGVWLRPLLFDTVAGAWANVTRIAREGFISRHAHPCPVHAYVLSGSWKYAERDWTAKAGAYLFEPPGDIHTLIGLPGGSETLFWIGGALIELDEEGRTLGHSDVFTRIEQAADHFAAAGLGRDYVKQFIR
ncbi:2,4'-dihydroxyacetophenone dioxygenase family protein [Erythrobacter sp. EC-HK427]|uniref:2,4'-dihydroxyacetophenone dioxygenase family protein n=1 Tax=Erythrobacter sp. EC-HK427 TaxID=2038396 RepID=UPI00125540E4|nr:2,4'-dihydroxyacetophenone dioxygenase family protein [Erythrobacter sp. EC-HK427]VVT10330.1 Cupin [Erythrobacter sp. EC-HK427]